jgi:hypothetical protein
VLTVVAGCNSFTASVEPFYAAAPRWNDYIVDDGAGVSGASGMPCLGDEPACLHGGELRALAIVGHDSCEGISISEARGAFLWKCVPGSPARAVSVGLRPGKGLADLITASGYLGNQVQVRKPGACGSTPIVSSPPAAWWDNPVVELSSTSFPPTAATTVLSDASTLYVVSSSRLSNDVMFVNDGIALVVLPGETLTYAGDAADACAVDPLDPSHEDSALLCVVGRRFIWLEGFFDAGGSGGTGTAADANVISSSRFVRLHRATVAFTNAVNTSHGALGLLGTRGVTLSEVAIIGSSGDGLWLDNAVDTRAYGVSIAGSVGYGLAIDLSTRSTFQELRSFGNNQGIRIFNSTSDTTLVDVITASNLFDGLFTEASGTTISHMTSVNNDWGIDTSGADDFTATQLVLANNEISGIDLDGTDMAVHEVATISNGMGIDVATPNVAVYGLLIAGGNGTDCNAPTGTIGLTDSCDHCPATGDCVTPSTGALFVASAASELTGKISLDDPVSAFDVSGAAPAPTLEAAGAWLELANRFRVWGNEGGAFPTALNRAPCTAGDCRIWEWTLLTGSALRGVHGAFASGASCPSEAALTVTDRQLVPRTYLLSAVELWADGRGNDNGLCESDEACVFSPNIGAYQGQGALLEPCLFPNSGAVTGVSLYGHASN